MFTEGQRDDGIQKQIKNLEKAGFNTVYIKLITIKPDLREIT